MSGEAIQNDSRIPILLGILPDGRVLVDFQLQRPDHLKLTVDEALELAQGLAETAKLAASGHVIQTVGPFSDG